MSSTPSGLHHPGTQFTDPIPEPKIDNDNPTYLSPSFRIDNLDQLQPVHYLILQHYRNVDPLTLIRVSKSYYESIIPQLYRKVMLDEQTVDKFFYGMLDLSSERFKKGQGKLHAIKQVRILDINDTKSALTFLDQCKKFGRAKSALKGSTPFEKVRHLAIDESILKGYMIAQLGDRDDMLDYVCGYTSGGGPGIDESEEKNDPPIPNGPFLNAIYKYLGDITTFCIDFGWGYDWEHSPLGGHVAKIGSQLLRSIIKKSHHLKKVIIHAETKGIDWYCKLDFFGLPEKLRDTIKIQFQLADAPGGLLDGDSTLKWGLYDVWRLYDDLWMFHKNEDQITFVMNQFSKEKIIKELKKAERLQSGMSGRNPLTDFGSVEEYTERRVRRFEQFRSCWKFPLEEDEEGKNVSCKCGEIMFHMQAASNHYLWKNPKWAKPKPPVRTRKSGSLGSFIESPRMRKWDCACGNCYDSDSECGSVMEGLDPASGTMRGKWDDRVDVNFRPDEGDFEDLGSLGNEEYHDPLDDMF